MSFDNSHLTSLTALINTAVGEVIAQYAQVGQAAPTLDSLKPAPFDVPEEAPAALSRAVKIIEAACKQLAVTVASPGHVIANVSAFPPAKIYILLILCDRKL